MDQTPAAGPPAVVTLGATALPLAGRARVYACGITPYDVTHLGHAATFCGSTRWPAYCTRTAPR